jgi:magnesium-transporting ATPase (P-type)
MEIPVMDTAEGSVAEPVPWQTLTAAQACAALGSNLQGLTQAEADSRLRLHGPNALPGPQVTSRMVILLRQLRSPLIYVLLAAAAASLALGHGSDAAFIGVVLLVNSLLGAWQEWRAEQQSLSLQQLMRLRASVLRDGTCIELDAQQLVCGDVVLLESGQRIPADLRLVTGHGLEVDESLLTGESVAVLKDADWLGTAGTLLADRRNMAYAGATVARGRAKGLVVATGRATQVGYLATTLDSLQAGKPPLTERMERFSRVVAVVVLAAAVLIGLVAVVVHQQSWLTMFTFAVALAVSAIPEGLPVAVTIALAIAARRMALRGAIVRNLPAVEGLGSCTLIASDKTGTLTCNRLAVCELRLADGTSERIAMDSVYDPMAPSGYAQSVQPNVVTPGPAELRRMVEIAVACNEAQLAPAGAASAGRGDPTDLALLELGARYGLGRAQLLAQWPQTAQIAFEPERQYAASLHRRDGGGWLAVKGAPERVFDLCALTPSERLALHELAARMASEGQRVLAVAEGLLPGDADLAAPATDPAGLRFAGFIGMVDPPRPGAHEAVQRCASAGIRVLMVTGDHPVTAQAIAIDLGIATAADPVITGTDLLGATAAQIEECVGRARVFARVTPTQKLSLVEAARRAGHYVAVTGDGVNDAPALRSANIGVAMGRGGTDVARDAADLVLSDDNFATIVAGVEEGRIAYRNIRHVVYLLTAAGIAEVLTVGVGVIAGLPLPLLPVQLLWLNLVTNGIQDVGLAFERGHGNELQVAPRPPSQPVFDRLMIRRGLLAGLWMSVVGLAAFVTLLRAGVAVEQARNSLLLLMVLMQNVDALNARSETLSLLRLPMRANPVLVGGVALALSVHMFAMYVPWLQSTLQLQPPSPHDWLVLPALALTLLAVMETQKWLWRRRLARA